MELKRYGFVILLALFVSSVIYFGPWFFESPAGKSDKTGSQNSSDKPRQTLSDFTLNETLGEDKVWKIQAPRASRSGDTVTLKSPFAVYQEHGDTRFTIKAEHGFYSINLRQLTLKEDVRLTRVQKNQVLTTDWLHWNKKTGIIRTNQPVKIRLPQGILRAQGMRTQLEEETVQFLANVRFSSQ